MCTPAAVDRACQWLNGVRLFSMDLSLSKSKQLHLIDSNNSKYCLSDTSSSFVDCSNSRNHRFTSQKMAKMNRLQKPNKVLHYFNAPPTYTDSDIRQLCLSIELEPVMIKVSIFFFIFSSAFMNRIRFCVASKNMFYISVFSTFM